MTEKFVIYLYFSGCSNDAIFNDLPPCLHGELCLDLTGNLMRQVPLFTNCEVPFIRALCKQTQLVQFHEGEYITRKGDIGHEMYFIKRGQVSELNSMLV